MSVGALLGCPAAAGRFRRAILQSGACHSVHRPEDAARVLDAFLGEAGVADLAGLRAAPLERILRAQLVCTLRAAELGVLLPFQPVVGDDLLPRPPLEAVCAGSAAGASMLIGTTSDEWSLFGFMDPDLETLDDAGFAARVVARVGAEVAPRVVEAYRKQAPAGTPAEHFVALETDFVFRVPALRLADAQARHAPVYVYEFAWRSPAQGGALGACHAIDLPFVFGTLDAPGVAAFAGSGGDAERLRDAAMDAWAGFARGAHPHDAPLPDWPRHDPETRPSLVFDREIRVDLARRDAPFRAWEGLR
jgi:para-nitrobenzyl esterase